MIPLAFVLAVMPRIPAECSLYRGKGACPVGTIGHYEQGKDSRAIAEAIAELATDEREGIEDAVYAAYESGNRLDATGDGGKSHGAWQIPVVRASALNQLAYWMAMRDRSLAVCADRPRAKRLALLASGSCLNGTRKVAKRDAVVEDLLEQSKEWVP